MLQMPKHKPPFRVRVIDCKGRYPDDSRGTLECYEATSLGIDTPRIMMDAGGVVYGYEVWWTEEDA